MAFKFYIDGQLVDQPVNDTALRTTIRRDQSLNSLFITQDANIIWNGNNAPDTGEISAYTYLKNIFDNGICNEVGIEIYDQQSASVTERIYIGVLKIPQMQIDHQRQLISCKVQDNSFYSYINNNKSLKVNLEGLQTKEANTLTPLTKYTVDLFNSSNCIYGSTVGFLYGGFLIEEVFEFVIKALTDDRVGFRSDFLSGLDNKIILFTGQALINAINVFPNAQGKFEISFSELVTELNKVYNLSYYIDSLDELNPVFVIEDTESLYQTETDPYHFADIKELDQSVDSSRLYSKVLTGDTNKTGGGDPWFTMPNNVSYFAFEREEFFPLGQCNTDAELNLESNIAIDTNAIQDALVGQNTSWLDTLFFIECNNFDTVNRTCDAVQYPLGLLGNCFYNLGLNNFNKMQRHSTTFETAFGNFLGIGGDGFKASLGDILLFSNNPNTSGVFIPSAPLSLLPGGIEDPVVFTNETIGDNYDGNGNYDNVTGDYTVPVTGDYSFVFNSDFIISNIIIAPGLAYLIKVTMTINRYDSGNVLQESNSSAQFYTNNGDFNQTVSLVTTANATDYLNCKIEVQFQGLGSNFNVAFQDTSYFSCNGTPDSGIVITNGNNNIRKYLYEFQYDISQTDFNLIRSQPAQVISFEKDGLTRFGWIDTMQRNDWTGMTNIKLITNNALTSQ